MRRTNYKSILIIASIFTLCTCIDPYNPVFSGYDSLLVVEGMITDQNSSYNIRLSRTLLDQKGHPAIVPDAAVYVTDNDGNRSDFHNKGDGNYKTDSTEFKGTTGKTYVLHIRTSEGSEYESDACFMQSVSDIDSIYFAKDQEYINNGTKIEQGINIFIDSKDGDNNQYYRWDYDETWKFKIPIPKLYIYANCEVIYTVPGVENEYCWKNSKSESIITGMVFQGQSGGIMKKPVTFIATDKSDRLMLEYSILIKQYSISKNEYEFWENLRKMSTTGGEIFVSQPYPITSNLHSINNPNERVMGYFQVSAVKQKRKFISFNEIAGLQLPFYHYPCERIEAICTNPFVDDYCTEFNDIYRVYTKSNNYYFIEPLFRNGLLDKLVFAKAECSNCLLTGTNKKPDFWKDIN